MLLSVSAIGAIPRLIDRQGWHIVRPKLSAMIYRQGLMSHWIQEIKDPISYGVSIEVIGEVLKHEIDAKNRGFILRTFEVEVMITKNAAANEALRDLKRQVSRKDSWEN